MVRVPFALVCLLGIQLALGQMKQPRSSDGQPMLLGGFRIDPDWGVQPEQMPEMGMPMNPMMGMPELYGMGAQPEQYGMEEPMPEQYGGGKGDEKKKQPEEDEEDLWKWEPPFPCHVTRQGRNGSEVAYTTACPHDLQCNVGPVSYMMGNDTWGITMCAKPGFLQLYHACSVQHYNESSGDKVQVKEQRCPMASQCSLGPFMVQTRGMTVEATYCSMLATARREDYENKTQGAWRASRACRLENEYGTDLVQRYCPRGYKCTLGPMDAIFNDEKVRAFACEEEEEEWEWTLEETIMYMVSEKGVPPMVILGVVQHMMENDMEIKPKKLYEYAMKYAKENDLLNPRQGMSGPMMIRRMVEDVLHRMHHMALLRQQHGGQMGGGHGHDGGDRELMMMMRKMLSMLMGRREDDREVGEMVQYIMKMLMGGKEEEKDKSPADMLKYIMKMLMGEKEEEKEKSPAEMLMYIMKMMMGEKEDEKEKSPADMIKWVLSQFMEGNNDEREHEKMVRKVVAMMMGRREDDREVGDMVKYVMKMLKGMMEKKDDDEEGPMEMIKKMLEHMMEHKKEEKEEKGSELKEMMEMMMKMKEMHDKQEEDKKDDTMDFMKQMLMMRMMEPPKKDKDMEELKQMVMMMALMNQRQERQDDSGDMAKMMMAMAGGRAGEQERDGGLRDMMGMMKKGKDGGDMLKDLMGKMKGEERRGGDELFELLSQMEKAFEASGMKEEDVPEPLAKLMHMLHHEHLWEQEKMMRAAERGEEPELYRVMKAVFAMFEKMGVTKEDIPEPIKKVLHHVHHEHLWMVEKKMRAANRW